MQNAYRRFVLGGAGLVVAACAAADTASETPPDDARVLREALSPDSVSIDEFSTTDDTLSPGASLTLVWKASNATGCSLNGQPVAAEGTLVDTPAAASSYVDYVLRCEGAGASAEAKYRVAMRQPVSALAAGRLHTCAIVGDGSTKCWGSNESLQLGNPNLGFVGYGRLPNQMGNDLPPLDLGVMPDSTPYVALAVATGGSEALSVDHSCALLTGGMVKCWGDNTFGQLGQDNRLLTGRPKDIPVVNLQERAKAIAAGGNFTCALLAANGTIKCWGGNGKGQLGQGHKQPVGTGDNNTPLVQDLQPINLGSGAKAVAAGGEHACALLEDGAVKCWGNNSAGQLGQDTTGATIGTEATGPASMEALAPIKLGARAAMISLGLNHSCALLETGAVKCWGGNDLGQLGQNNNLQVGTGTILMKDLTPIALGKRAKLLAAGANHTCVVLEDDAVLCWGNNVNGQLGQGDTQVYARDNAHKIEDLLPLLPRGAGPVGIESLAAGGAHTCVLLQGGRAQCWGNGRWGQLGLEDAQDRGDGQPPGGREELGDALPLIDLGH